MLLYKKKMIMDFMKRIFALCISISFTFSISAQEQQNTKSFLRDKMIFGTEVGIIFGTPYGPAEEGAKGKPGLGLHGAIFARYDIAPRFGMQLGLAYNAKKASYSSPVIDQDYTYYQDLNLPDGSTVTAVIETFFNGTAKGKFNNHYLEAPVMVFFNLSDKWSVLGGGYAALLLKGEHKVWATGVVGDNFDTVEDEFSDESEFISKWDFGLNTGVNYKIYKQIECELKISSGLKSIFKDEYQLAEDTIRNIYMELKANYTFQL